MFGDSNGFIATEELFDLMVVKTNELSLLDIDNRELYKQKKEEIELIKQVIVLRRSVFKPIPYRLEGVSECEY